VLAAGNDALDDATGEVHCGVGGHPEIAADELFPSKCRMQHGSLTENGISLGHVSSQSMRLSGLGLVLEDHEELACFLFGQRGVR